MFGLAGLCLVMVTAYTLAGGPKIATPPEAEVIASRVIRLSGDISGAAQVRDADGTLIADLPPDRGGFIAGIERVVARERTNHRVPLDARSLDYGLYVEEGEHAVETEHDYTTHNTQRLSVEEVAELLSELPEMREALAKVSR